MAAARRKLSILMLSHDGRENLEHSLPALQAQREPGCDWELWLLDNASSDGTADWVRERHPWVRLVESRENLGFAAGNNRLAELADGDDLILLNDDTLPEADWLAAFADAAGSSAPDVAALAGAITSWDGERLDFGYGIRTFDGHAFQLDHGLALASSRRPTTGEELPFACGANMWVRRTSFLAAGGFDPNYFAYLEDVDLGWRLWSGGERVVAASAARVRHRASATSRRVGAFVRGSLFERNALLTAWKNLDDDLWPKLMPAILVTFLSRLESLVVAAHPGAAEVLRRDPFTGRMFHRDRLAAGSIRQLSRVEQLRRVGPVEFVRRGLRWAARRIRQRLAGGGFVLSHPQALAEMRAASHFLALLDSAAEARAAVGRRRRRSEREICERFPLYLVPTYLGDTELFASAGFQSLLPESPPLERRELAEVMALDARGSE